MKPTLAFLLLLTTTVFAQPTGSLNFSWDPNTETDLVGYKFHQGTASRVYTTTTSVGLNTTATATGLVPGTRYFWAVTAVNSAGLESDFSNEVTFALPSGAPVTQVTGITWSRAASTITVRWSASPANQMVQRYRVQFNPVGSTAVETFYTAGLAITNPVTAGFSYRVQVAAEGLAGIGPGTEFDIGAVPGTVGRLLIRGGVTWGFPN